MIANLTSAYTRADGQGLHATALTRGPWHPQHQHGGPPSALVCRAIEQSAQAHGLTHVGRLTVNLIRPVPIGECQVEVEAEYVGRNAGHYSARLLAAGKEVARFTALMQREFEMPLPQDTPGHPWPGAPKSPAESSAGQLPFASDDPGYADLIETKVAEGRLFHGPCAAWFRMRHPLVGGEEPSPYQRVAVVADCGNGISAALDFKRYSFLNCDLTINLLRRPVGDWICLQSRSAFGGNGCGLAESALYDQRGLMGRATQRLAVRHR